MARRIPRLGELRGTGANAGRSAGFARDAGGQLDSRSGRLGAGRRRVVAAGGVGPRYGMEHGLGVCVGSGVGGGGSPVAGLRAGIDRPTAPECERAAECVSTIGTSVVPQFVCAASERMGILDAVGSGRSGFVRVSPSGRAGVGSPVGGDAEASRIRPGRRALGTAARAGGTGDSALAPEGTGVTREGDRAGGSSTTVAMESSAQRTPHRRRSARAPTRAGFAAGRGRFARTR